MASLDLLAVRCKRSEPADLITPIYQHIVRVHSERQAKEADKDLATIQRERDKITGQHGSTDTLERTLKWQVPTLPTMPTCQIAQSFVPVEYVDCFIIAGIQLHHVQSSYAVTH